eukprot:5265497-Amphidinium_carterae.1
METHSEKTLSDCNVFSGTVYRKENCNNFENDYHGRQLEPHCDKSWSDGSTICQTKRPKKSL